MVDVLPVVISPTRTGRACYGRLQGSLKTEKTFTAVVHDYRDKAEEAKNRNSRHVSSLDLS